MFYAYYSFILLLKDGVSKPSVFRSVVFTTLRFLNKSYSYDLAMSLLHTIIQIGIERCPLLVFDHMHVIVGKTLFVYHTFNVKESEGATKFQSNIVKVLKLICCSLPKGCEEFGKKIENPQTLLDPLPVELVDSEVFMKLQFPDKVGDEICAFVEREGSKKYPLLRMTGLQHIHKRMQALSAKSSFEDHGISSEIATHFLKYLGELAASSEESDEYKLAVSNCLNDLAGLCIPMSMNSSLYTEMKNELPCPAKRDVKILELLSECLVHDNVAIAAAAIESAEAFLSMPIGKDALNSSSTKIQQYVSPFTNANNSVELDDTGEEENDNSAWIANEPYQKWVFNVYKSVTCKYCCEDVFKLFLPLCKLEEKVCKSLLPYLFYKILHDEINPNWSSCCSSLADHISYLCSRANDTCPEKVRTVLRCVDYIFQHLSPFGNAPLKVSFWTHLDLLCVARAAIIVEFPFTALRYVEIWCDLHGKPRLGSLTAENSSHFKQYQSLLVDIYGAISKPDTFQGIDFVPGLNYQISCYEKHGNWREVLGSCSAVLSSNPSGINPDRDQLVGTLLRSLKKEDFCNIAHYYLKGLRGSPGEYGDLFSDYEYELAWRTCDWTIPNVSCKESKQNVSRLFNKTIYGLLCNVAKGQHSHISALVTDIQIAVLEMSKRDCLETGKSLSSSASKFLQLKELSEICSSLSSAKDISRTVCEWKSRSENILSFDALETATAFRLSLIKACCEYLRLSDSCSNPDSLASSPGFRNSPSSGKLTAALYNGLVDILLFRAERATKASKFDVARNSIAQLEKLTFCDELLENRHKSTLKWLFCTANAHWKMQEYDMAKNNLELITSHWEHSDYESECRTIAAKAFMRLGMWKGYFRSDPAEVIIQDFLCKAIDLLEKENSYDLAKAHFNLAKYLDSQYQSINDSLKSETFEEAETLRQKSAAELIRLNEMISSSKSSKKAHISRDLQVYKVQSEKQLKREREELERIKTDLTGYLEGSLRSYIHALKLGSRYDLSVFRICSLWFSNSANAALSKSFDKEFSQIPSYKFVSVIYQLAARLGCENSGM